MEWSVLIVAPSLPAARLLAVSDLSVACTISRSKPTQACIDGNALNAKLNFV